MLAAHHALVSIHRPTPETPMHPALSLLVTLLASSLAPSGQCPVVSAVQLRNKRSEFSARIQAKTHPWGFLLVHVQWTKLEHQLQLPLALTPTFLGDFYLSDLINQINQSIKPSASPART